MQSESAEPGAATRGARRSASLRAWRVWLGALRAKQYTKNLILFAALVFGGEIGSARAWLAASTAFVAYCAASSAAYLVNDVLDAEADRGHPRKRLRAVASGAISPGAAVCVAAALAVLALALAGSLGAPSLAYLLAFLLLHVPITAWLLACTALLSGFLALAKRRAELVVVRRGEAVGRSSLRRYSIAQLDRALAALLGITLVVYVLYAVREHAPAFLLTVPLVAHGLGRYLVLVRREGRGEEPESVLLSDRRLLLTIVAWAVLAGTLVYVT
jgi:4-hydroxybenzoate polyprenyltransferase